MKKLLIVLFSLIAAVSAYGQTFTITEVFPYPGMSETDQSKAKKVIGQEVKLTFTDDDVRVSTRKEDGGYDSIMLQKKGNNIYRVSTSSDGGWDSYNELELETLLGYIRGFQFTHIHHGDFGGGFKAKRK